jgi:DNA-binding CsgD family transcriptional regulator
VESSELLERARAEYRAGEVARASLTCVRVAELSRAAGDVATLADAAVVVRNPVDRVVRARVHALAAEALVALGDADPLRSSRVRAQLDATLDPFAAAETDPPALDDADPESAFLDLQARIGELISDTHAEQRLVLARQAIHLGRRTANLEYEAWGRRWRMDAFATLGRFAELHDEISLAEPLAERLGPDWQSLLLLTHASERLRRGDYEEAARLADEARDLGREGGEAGYFHLIYAFEVAKETGREIDKVTAEVRRLMDDMPFHARSWLCLALVAAGRLDEAAELWHVIAPHAARIPPRAVEFLIAAAGNAEVCVALGDTATAEELYELMLPSDGRHVIALAYAPYNCPVSLALGRLALLTGRTEAAHRHLTDALAAARRVEARPRVAEAHFELARLLGPRNKAGRDHADAALDIARRLGMAPLARAVEAWVGPTLTVRENEIAGLVAEGLTNSRIAARLTLSERTVENHVSRILHKLLLGSRTALAVWYRDHRS